MITVPKCKHDPALYQDRILTDGPDDPLRYCPGCDTVVDARTSQVVGGIQRASYSR